MIDKRFREKGPELLRGKKHGRLDPQCIGKALFIIFGAVAKQVSMLQHHPGLLLLFLQPAVIAVILAGSSFEKPDMYHGSQNQEGRKQYGK
jgi:hypothetical protein